MSTSKAGFTPPNYTQTPNTLFDLMPVMSNAELRITLVLTRLTIGWHKQRTDQMSVPELAELAGLSPSSAKTGIAEGVKRGTIKRIKTRDHLNRPTYKYGIVISSEHAVFEAFERPRAKQTENGASDNVQGNSSGQNLTGSEFNRLTPSSGQNLTLWPRKSSGQNLTASYKEQRNLISVKEKERENTALNSPSEEVVLRLQGPVNEKAQKAPQESHAEQPSPADAGAAHAANQRRPDPVRDEAQVQATPDGQATDLEKVPGGGAAGGGASQEYIVSKLGAGFVEKLLGEIQPLGVDRATDWFALPLPRVKALAQEARATHEALKIKATTRFRDLLDDECRRVNTPVAAPAPLDDEGEIDMAALMASAPLNGNRRNR